MGWDSITGTVKSGGIWLAGNKWQTRRCSIKAGLQLSRTIVISLAATYILISVRREGGELRLLASSFVFSSKGQGKVKVRTTKTYGGWMLTGKARQARPFNVSLIRLMCCWTSVCAWGVQHLPSVFGVQQENGLDWFSWAIPLNHSAFTDQENEYFQFCLWR